MSSSKKVIHCIRAIFSNKHTHGQPILQNIDLGVQNKILTVLAGQDRLEGVGTKSSSSEKVTCCGSYQSKNYRRILQMWLCEKPSQCP